MKRFSDFGIEIKDDKQMFDVPKVSITDILNCEIEILAFEVDIKTKYGEGRCVVRIKQDEKEYKFFTNSSRIKQSLELVPKDGFPFMTVIKQKRFESGGGKIFYFS